MDLKSCSPAARACGGLLTAAVRKPAQERTSRRAIVMDRLKEPQFKATRHSPPHGGACLRRGLPLVREGELKGCTLG